MMAFCAELFAGKPEFGNFSDAYGVLVGLDKYAGGYPATVFAVALLDACIIGAAAVSLATAYAIGDTFRAHHSLHRKVTDATGFYVVYAALIAIGAALVLYSSDRFLGFMTNLVQALAGVLLPSATVFLLLLCNDKAVLGPWVNGRKLNLFTGAIIWVLVMLSIILTAATAFPDISGEAIIAILTGGSVVGLAGYAITAAFRDRPADAPVDAPAFSLAQKMRWRMPSLDRLAPPRISPMTKVWMGVLRAYLLVAIVLFAYRIFVAALGDAS
jgi:hypothetical protein